MPTSTPANWSVGKATLQDAAARLRSMLADRRASAIWVGATSALPAYYDDYCRRRYLAWRQTHPSMDWEDVEPIFALAAVSVPSANGTDAELRREMLKADFPRLRGGSRIAWRDAERLIMQAWSALAEFD